MSSTCWFVLIATLFGFSTAIPVQLPVGVSIPTPIIGEGIYEDITMLAPSLTSQLDANLTISRHLQTADFQAGMLDAINRERAANGLPRLCMNWELQNAAQSHSSDMASKDFMSHTGSDGSTMSQRIVRAGYDRIASGENVAAGHTTVDEVMKAWMASPSHRENILRNRFTMFGCGYAYNDYSVYKHHWTQNFGLSNTEHCS